MEDGSDWRCKNVMVSHESTLRFLKDRERARQHHLDAAFERAIRDFGCISKFIINDYNPQAIWQWGSLLDRNRFSEISDIDIAIEGLEDPQAIFDIYNRAGAMTEFPVDVIELEKIEQEYASLIRRKGERIYERP